jgi:hypothetical protein
MTARSSCSCAGNDGARGAAWISKPPAATRRRSSTAWYRDPVRRTLGHDHRGRGGRATGGFYELIDPANTAAINVTNRDRPTRPAHLVKRQAVGGLSFEPGDPP